MTSSDAPIAIREVSKWYGRVVGLVRATTEITPGITGLLGPNGAGKSTLMKLITGQLRPSLGSVHVFGKDVWKRPSARRQLGYAPEVDAFWEEMTPRAFVRRMARISGLSSRRARRDTEDALELTGLCEFATKPLRACSKGMRQRVKLAQALVHDPQVIVLDEPLGGIDPRGRRELLALFAALRDRGKTLVISSHILHEIEAVTDRIVLVAKGRILASGTLAEIRRLMSEFPLRVRIVCDRGRQLGARLLESGVVSGVREARQRTAGGLDHALVVELRDVERFFRELPSVLIDLDVDVRRVETLDDSAAAVFNYLVRRHESVDVERDEP